METRDKVYDTEDKTLYIGVTSHYFKVSDAKEVYKKAITNEEAIDDTILFEVAKDDVENVETISIGVVEAERFALTILNLCNSIKY